MDETWVNHVADAQAYRIERAKRCDRCGSTRNLSRWYGDGGALAVTHGFHSMRCLRCIHRAQLAHSWKQALRLPKLLWKVVADR
jgi:hypothetical protein